AFTAGLFEGMDEGSRLVAEAVAPPPGGKVVDACAGAGGKTLALAALLGGQGRILALDPNGKKLEELRRRARRAGLSNVAARELKALCLPDEARLYAWDRVLVDAPCSGLGTLRRNPEARWRLQPAAVDAFPAQQLSLLVLLTALAAASGSSPAGPGGNSLPPGVVGGTGGPPNAGGSGGGLSFSDGGGGLTFGQHDAGEDAAPATPDGPAAPDAGTGGA